MVPSRNGRRPASHGPRDLRSFGARVYLSYLALTLLAHGTALFTFFAVDDFVFLSQVGFPRWEGVADAFAQRPLAFALFHGHRLAFGTHPLPFHVTALLLHVVNAWLTYALGTYVLPRRSLALAAGAIFALHPAAHTPLAWTSAGFNEIPAVTFTLLATLVLARSIATRAPFVVSCLPVLSGVLALGFKQQAILAPLYLVVSGAIVGWQAPDQASRQVATRRLVWGVLPFTPLGIYFLLFILPRMQLVFGLPYQLGNDIAEVLSALARLVTHALNPVAVWRDALGFQGAVPSATERWPWSWLATLMVATVVCIGATVAWRRREGAHYLGLSLLLVGTLAWAAFLPLHLTDYYVYFSLPAAACLLAFPAVAARDVLSQWGRRCERLAVAALAIAVFGGGAHKPCQSSRRASAGRARHRRGHPQAASDHRARALRGAFAAREPRHTRRPVHYECAPVAGAPGDLRGIRRG